MGVIQHSYFMKANENLVPFTERLILGMVFKHLVKLSLHLDKSAANLLILVILTVTPQSLFRTRFKTLLS